MASGQMSADDTELNNRHIKSNGGGLKIPIPFVHHHHGNNTARKDRNDLSGRNSQSDLDGIVVSVDRLVRMDGASLNNTTQGRNIRDLDSDVEKGGIGRDDSMYSHEEKVSF